MSKILTITLNPAVDKNSSTKRVIQDSKLRCEQPVFEPGGGGINVSRAIEHLGGDSLAIFPAGGPTGIVLEELLTKQNIKHQSIKTNDWTRENLNIFEHETQKQYRFIMPGPQLSPTECEDIKKLVETAEDFNILVISGSLPQGTDGQLIADLSKIAHAKNAKCILDTSGEPLKHALTHGHIFMTKPNHNELASITGKEIDTAQDLEEMAKQIIAQGHVETLVISLGPQGALLVTEDIVEQIIPPSVRRLSTVGAGDSMVAGMAFCLADNKDIRYAIRYGVACGTAATMNHGSQLCKKEDVEHIMRWILDKHPLI